MSAMPARNTTDTDGIAQLLTVGEAASRLSVHQRTVRNWARAGLLEEVRLGPHLVRVTASSVAAFVADGRTETAAAP